MAVDRPSMGEPARPAPWPAVARPSSSAPLDAGGGVVPGAGVEALPAHGGALGQELAIAAVELTRDVVEFARRDGVAQRGEDRADVLPRLLGRAALAGGDLRHELVGVPANAGTLAGGQLDGFLELLGKLRRQVVGLPARQPLGERVQGGADRLLGPVLIDARAFAHVLIKPSYVCSPA